MSQFDKIRGKIPKTVVLRKMLRGAYTLAGTSYSSGGRLRTDNNKRRPITLPKIGKADAHQAD